MTNIPRRRFLQAAAAAPLLPALLPGSLRADVPAPAAPETEPGERPPTIWLDPTGRVHEPRCYEVSKMEFNLNYETLRRVVTGSDGSVELQPEACWKTWEFEFERQLEVDEQDLQKILRKIPWAPLAVFWHRYNGAFDNNPVSMLHVIGNLDHKGQRSTICYGGHDHTSFDHVSFDHVSIDTYDPPGWSEQIGSTLLSGADLQEYSGRARSWKKAGR